MKKTVLIDVVGLSDRVMGQHTPFLNRWKKERESGVIQPVLPAVTCSVQATYLTGKMPAEHGVVGNGWLFRDELEVKLWRQSNRLVLAEKIWEKARRKDPSFTCANMFWWYNMYSSVDYAVTPRPQYLADGRKMPDCYSQPAGLRDELQATLGTFPLFNFWGPTASIRSSQWIADASRYVIEKYEPTLTLVYLPHLDYCLQKFGQDPEKTGKEIGEIDTLLEEFIGWLEQRGISVQLISEYGITEVSRPVHINRILREHDCINVRVERGLELLDAGMSDAFALADHQIAHVYVNKPERLKEIRKVLEETEGIELVLDRQAQKKYGLDHDRSGELVAVADRDSWFTYYYWNDDARAPDFARTVEIHKKPGYDPVEMFFDPEKKFIMPRAGLKLLKKKLGFRSLMDLIPLDASLIRGSHGRVDLADQDKAIFIGDMTQKSSILPTEVCTLLLEHIFQQKQ